MSKESQTKKILHYLQSGQTITPIKALSLFGCMRLAARINDLRRSGYNIKSKIVKTLTSKYAEYSMEVK